MERYTDHTATTRPNPADLKAPPIVVRSVMPTTWDEALKGAAESKLQQEVATHEKALLWRDLYRGKHGSDQDNMEYQTLMEELDIVGAGDAVTAIPSTNQFQLDDGLMAFHHRYQLGLPAVVDVPGAAEMSTARQVAAAQPATHVVDP